MSDGDDDLNDDDDDDLLAVVVADVDVLLLFLLEKNKWRSYEQSHEQNELRAQRPKEN